jgi:hypothetical protein
VLTVFLRALHASIAFARQLLLTFANEAAASESFNFSAYPHMFGPDEVVRGCSELFSFAGFIDGEEDADIGGCFEEGGVNGIKGDGGTSIELWFVIPRQTLLASRDVIPVEIVFCGVSVSLPSSCEPSSSLSTSSSSSLSEGDS